jgi:hypothetical protein
MNCYQTNIRTLFGQLLTSANPFFSPITILRALACGNRNGLIKISDHDQQNDAPFADTCGLQPESSTEPSMLESWMSRSGAGSLAWPARDCRPMGQL